MNTNKGLNKNYKYTDYIFEKTTARYVVMNDTGAVFMLLFPNEYLNLIIDNYETVNLGENGFPNHCGRL